MLSKSFYHIKLVEKIESMQQRMQRKAKFFLKEQSTTKPSRKTYGFRSRSFPKECIELEQFEKDLFNVVKMVRFNNKRDQFQAEVNKDINKMEQCPDILYQHLQNEHYRLGKAA